MPMKATGPTAQAIVDLVRECGVLIAKEDSLVQREALAELVSVYLMPFHGAERDAVLANIMNTARQLAKMRDR